MKQLFLQANGRLAWTAPQDEISADGEENRDAFVSDPHKPVPYTETITPRMTNEYMVDDQRFASRRPDVLTYQTDAFEVDTVIAGPVEANLWVSTTGTDSDWIVKVIDVYPDLSESTPLAGYQMLIRSEVIRGRYRNDYAKPEPLCPVNQLLFGSNCWMYCIGFKRGTV
jgi:predicted acyl esterase